MGKIGIITLLKKYWFFFLIPVMLIVFFVYISSDRRLNVYVPGEGRSVYTIEEPEEETERTYGASMWRSEKTALEMPVPEGWSRVTKSGHDTFIHAATSSSIQVQVLSYYPRVNAVTADTISADLVKRGYELNSFDRTGDTSYFVTYSSAVEAGTIDMFERVMWDRENVVKIVVTVNDIYLDRLSDEIDFCLDNVVWNCADPVPEGVFLEYMPYGDFEFGVPDTWSFGEADGGFYAVDDATGSTLTASVVDEELTIDDVNQYDYAQFMQNGRSNFGMTRFEQYEDFIYAEATYNSNEDGSLIDMLQIYGISAGKARVLTFEFADDYASDLYGLCSSCMGCYRAFGTESATETEPAAEPDSTMANPGTEEETESEQAQTDSGNNPETEAVKDAETETEYGDEVDTFAAALVQVAAIPAGKAQEISDLWTAMNAGSPSYAQAVKESASSVIIYLETAEGMKFYLTVNKDGTLMEIRANAEDGAVMYQKPE